MATDTTEQPNNLVLFDGVCNLCDGFVQFLLRFEKGNRLTFTSLQSEAGAKILKANNLPTTFESSVLFYKDGVLYKKSGAVLRIARFLHFPFKLAIVFRVIPSFLLDVVYDLVARNRYKMFGKKDQCMIPTPALKSRFI